MAWACGGGEGVSLCFLHDHSAAVGQRRSGSRWSGCAGPPEATCRSSASTSNADGSCASPDAASCDLALPPAAHWRQRQKDERMRNDESQAWNMQAAQFCRMAGLRLYLKFFLKKYKKKLDLWFCDISTQSCDLRDPEWTLWPRTYFVSLGALWRGSGFVYRDKPLLRKQTI